MNLDGLKDFFLPHEIEWRIARAGETNGKIWAKAVAYVDNRAIMNRLDQVCGLGNWCNKFAPGPSGGVICGIGLYFKGDTESCWVYRWDGAENPKTEPVKGGLSNAMKRAAVQWGIGRYLYDLPETFVKTGDYNEYQNKGSFTIKGTKNKKHYSWQTPPIPKQFLPKGSLEVHETPPRMDPDNEIEPTEQNVPMITQEQRIALGEICETKNWNVAVALKRLAAKYGIDKIDYLPRTQYQEVAEYLDSFNPAPPRGES